MYDIKKDIEGKTWVSNTANNSLRCTKGVIASINEWENTCEVYYIDKDKRLQRLHNVAVESSGYNDWFPELGEEVQLQDFNDDRPVIIGSSDGDWINRKRDKQWDPFDVMALTSCGPSGLITI